MWCSSLAREIRPEREWRAVVLRLPAPSSVLRPPVAVVFSFAAAVAAAATGAGAPDGGGGAGKPS